MPAFANATSSRPYVSAASSIAIERGVIRHVGDGASHVEPFFLEAGGLGRDRVGADVDVTRAPCAASTSPYASPSPLAPPVTRTPNPVTSNARRRSCWSREPIAHREARPPLRARTRSPLRTRVRARIREQPGRPNRAVRGRECRSPPSASDRPSPRRSPDRRAASERRRRRGIVKGAHGARQVTYNHHPLYYFVGDSAPGDVNGQGCYGYWFALSGKGAGLTRPACRADAALGSPTQRW